MAKSVLALDRLAAELSVDIEIPFNSSFFLAIELVILIFGTIL